jgi:hypothetical protein
MPQPGQIIVYGNNSSNSRKSTFSTHSNNMNPKSPKKKIHPFNIISNRFATDKSKNKNYIKKYNTRRSQENKYSINFMKKMEKIKTEVNLSKRKTTILKNKRQSDITKILKTRINLANITNMNNSTQVQKKVKVQMFTNPNTKESETIRNINIISNKSIEEKDFDIFNFESKVDMENTLYLIGSYIYKKFDFSKIIKEKKFVNWAKKIASGYSRLNPYHTDLHAADVAQTCFLFLLQEGVFEKNEFKSIIKEFKKEFNLEIEFKETSSVKYPINIKFKYYEVDRDVAKNVIRQLKNAINSGYKIKKNFLAEKNSKN